MRTFEIFGHRLVRDLGDRWPYIAAFVVYGLFVKANATVAHALIVAALLILGAILVVTWINDRLRDARAEQLLRSAGEDWCRVIKATTGRSCRITYVTASGKRIEIASDDFDPNGFDPVVKEIYL